MKNIILIAEKGSASAILSALSPSFDAGVIGEDSGIWVRSRQVGGDVLSICRDASASCSYDDPDEQRIISETFTVPEFYFVPYRDIGVLKEILFELVARVKVLIDNDFGLIAEGVDFCDNWIRDPQWDWMKRT